MPLTPPTSPPPPTSSLSLLSLRHPRHRRYTRRHCHPHCHHRPLRTQFSHQLPSSPPPPPSHRYHCTCHRLSLATHAPLSRNCAVTVSCASLDGFTSVATTRLATTETTNATTDDKTDGYAIVSAIRDAAADPGTYTSLSVAPTPGAITDAAPDAALAPTPVRVWLPACHTWRRSQCWHLRQLKRCCRCQHLQPSPRNKSK